MILSDRTIREQLDAGRIVIDAIRADQFAGVPKVSAANQVTLNEEERVVAYFGGGYLYADPRRQEPLL